MEAPVVTTMAFALDENGQWRAVSEDEVADAFGSGSTSKDTAAAEDGGERSTEEDGGDDEEEEPGGGEHSADTRGKQRRSKKTMAELFEEVSVAFVGRCVVVGRVGERPLACEAGVAFHPPRSLAVKHLCLNRTSALLIFLVPRRLTHKQR